MQLVLLEPSLPFVVNYRPSLNSLDIINDNVRSRCRFLNCEGSNVYVFDLGLNRTYILDVERQQVKIVGSAGKNIGEFKDPAGIEVDSRGDMIIAGAGNNRLQVFDQFKN